MQENYQKAIKWAEAYLAERETSVFEIRKGVVSNDLHETLRVCIMRLRESPCAMERGARFRDIKDVKDKIMVFK